MVTGSRSSNPKLFKEVIMTAAVTKFNGKIKVSVNEAGQVITTPTATEGFVGQLMDGVTTVLSTQEVPVGNGALVQRLLLVLGGNVLAVHSIEDNLGVSAFGKTFTVGK